MVGENLKAENLICYETMVDLIKDMGKEEIKVQLRRAFDEDPLRTAIQKAALFGSYLHGTPSQESDVDVLVEFKPGTRIGLFGLVGIQRRLGERLGRKVDLLTTESLSKYFREQVLDEAEVVYEG
jgi:predicted nucleotidyltransferase